MEYRGLSPDTKVRLQGRGVEAAHRDPPGQSDLRTEHLELAHLLDDNDQARSAQC